MIKQIDLRLLLAALLIGVAVFSNLYPKMKSLNDLNRVDFECHSEALPRDLNKIRKSCPIISNHKAKAIFWNEEGLNEDNEITATIVIKSRIKKQLIYPQDHLDIQVKADATIVARNKQTHQIMARNSIELSHFHEVILRYSNENQTRNSHQVHLFTLEIMKDCYYEIEVNEVRAYNTLVYLYHQMPVDGVHMRTLLPTLLVHTSPVSRGRVIQTYRLLSFLAIIGCSLFWISYILFFRAKKIVAVEVGFTGCFTVCCLVYTAPFDVGMTPVFRYMLVLCFGGVLADTFIARKALGINLGGLFGTFSFFFTLAAAVQFYVGYRYLAGITHPVIKETIPSGPRKNISVGNELITIKAYLHLILWGVLVLRLKWLSDSFRQILPLLGWCSMWIYEFSKGDDPFIGENKNPFLLNFNYLFLPCIVAIYQYASYEIDNE